MFDFYLEFTSDKKANGNYELLNSLNSFYSKYFQGIKYEKQITEDENFIISYLYKKSSVNFSCEKNDAEIYIFGDVYCKNSGYKTVFNPNQILDAENIYLLLRNTPNFQDFIKGDYKIIYYDKENTKLNIYNSRYSISPLYYAIDNNKIIVSTNLKSFSYLHKQFGGINYTSLIERCMFNYTLGENTFLKNVKLLRESENLYYSNDGISKDKFWDCKNLYSEKILSNEDALEKGSILFKNVVNSQVQDKEKICASLTGGFDGRTILSVLEKDVNDILLYSFGIKNSLNIKIPELISKELGYNYRPLFLEEEYREYFPEYAKKIVLFSDGMRPFESANYPYAFNILSDFSETVITGIFGSELLRTFQNVGVLVSNAFVELNQTSCDNGIWDDLKNKLIQSSYFSEEIIQKHFEEVKNNFYNNIFSDLSDYESSKRFYIFMIKEGLKKYFGGEVHSERIYARNRFPYLDDDFVDFIFTSPFAGVYSNALKPTPNQRFKAQYFYAKIMEKYKPELLKYNTDHGYPAKYVLSKYPILRIGIPYIFNKKKREYTNYREFKPQEWAELLYSSNINSDEIFTSEFSKNILREEFKTGKWLKNYNNFMKITSLNYWFNA